MSALEALRYPTSPAGSDAWGGTFPSHISMSGSVGGVVLVEGYTLYLPHVGTSPAVVDTRFRMKRAVTLRWSSTVSPADKSVARAAGTLGMPVEQQTREVLAALSLNKSQLAEILGVSRPTLYDWLNGKEPNPLNARRLADLLRLLERLEIRGDAPVSPRFLGLPLGENGESILEMLSARDVEMHRAEPLLRQAHLLSRDKKMRRQRTEERLRTLGFEDPSEELRKAQLAQNVAMMDWPKP